MRLQAFFVFGVAATLGCAQLFDIKERPETIGDSGVSADAGAKPFNPADCRSGPVMRECGGVSVDLCASADHCGGCENRCVDEAAGLKRCVEGMCHDHAWQAWDHVNYPECVEHPENPEIVVDQHTGLWWEKSAQAGVTVFSKAVDHCDALNAASFGGHSDWYLPTRIELMSVLDYDAKDPIRSKCMPTGLPLTSYMCTRSIKLGDPTEHWLLNLQFSTFSTLPVGEPESGKATVLCRPRCVRATKYASSANRFQIVSDGVFDAVTKVTWERGVANGGAKDKTKPDDPAAFERIGGVTYCRDRASGGDAYRLPTIKELASLVDERRSPGVDPLFTLGPKVVSTYWSDTRHVSLSLNPDGGGDLFFWVVWFDTGNVTGQNSNSYSRVRCVHPGNADAK